MAILGDKLGGVGRTILKAIPYIATYLVGRKMGEKGTRKEAKEEIAEQRDLADKGARDARKEINKKSTGDYIRGKDI